MALSRWIALALAAALLGSGCEAFTEAQATEVPGAAATITRGLRTPIPTPPETPRAAPAVSPSLAVPSPSPSPRVILPEDAQAQEVRAQIEKALSAPELAGIESLLLDHVSLSTAGGGSIMSREEALKFLRDHAGPGLSVGKLERSTLAPSVEVQTTGWPQKPPLANGIVTFDLHRYDAAGNQDDDHGSWKIDVIAAE